MGVLQLYDFAKTAGISNLLKVNYVHKNILKYTRGYMVSHCMSALINMGFFDELDREKRVDVDSFSKKHNIDKRILDSVCDYLYSLNILNKDEECYMLSSKGRPLFKISKGVFDLLYAYAPLFNDLESLLKREKVYNKDVFRREKFVATGTAELGLYVPFPIVKDIIRNYGFKKVLDLGCGSGDFLFSLAEDNRDMVCYGVDISKEAINYASKKAQDLNKSDRVKLAAADMFRLDEISVKWYDVEVITSMYVLHEFLFEGREKVIDLLKAIKENFPGRYLIICELCKKSSNSLRKKSTAVSEHHLFHALSNQGIITFEEWKQLFKEAGYKLAEVRRFDFAEQGYFVIK